MFVKIVRFFCWYNLRKLICKKKKLKWFINTQVVFIIRSLNQIHFTDMIFFNKMQFLNFEDLKLYVIVKIYIIKKIM